MFLLRVCVGGCSQKPEEAVGFLKQELQVVVDQPTWMPGTQPGFSAREVLTLDDRAMPPGLSL